MAQTVLKGQRYREEKASKPQTLNPSTGEGTYESEYLYRLRAAGGAAAPRGGAPTPTEREVLITIYATATAVSDCIIRGGSVRPLLWLSLRLVVGVSKPRQPILGLPDPEFIEPQDFTVTFRNGAPESASGDLNERQQLGLRIVREQGSISPGEYCAATGVAERTALRDLQELVTKGLLVARGKKRGSRYFLP